MAAPDHRAMGVEDADRGGVERDVEAGVALLGCVLLVLLVHGVSPAAVLPCEAWRRCRAALSAITPRPDPTAAWGFVPNSDLITHHPQPSPLLQVPVNY